jgi:hypothetical protein
MREIFGAMFTYVHVYKLTLTTALLPSAHCEPGSALHRPLHSLHIHVDTDFD